ncbi:hypothetical protein EHS25_008034 [Saitozyma podzolica]|uniref:Uncharacterized protein n=1 Tax=Saitozyma podzolica TaxID=1890683 RepID=A0A427YNE8_9TREE|nr:hypothetical protein EHS25_008034 [Saitozyma podzolica]
MTISPPGAVLSPLDLPPPPPALDPREPSSTSIPPRRGQRTPSKARSPAGSRAASPARPANPRSTSTDGSVPLFQPVPKSLIPSASPPAGAAAFSPAPPLALHGHHLSRPSSPSSIHSSSSAIFERDIELPAVPSLSLNPHPPPVHTLSHKSSRLSHLSHGSALDHTVPAVLDDAVEALTGTGASSRGLAGLEIEAPAAAGVGMARQNSATIPGMPGRKISSGPLPQLSSSRSPSPISINSGGSSVVSPAQSPPILGQLQSHQQQQQQSLASPVSPVSPTPATANAAATVVAGMNRPPMGSRMSTGQQLPGGWSSAWKTDEEPAPPVEETAKPVVLPAAALSPSAVSPTAATPPAAIPAHLTPTKDKRRISFISYNDLLLSVPTAVTPLEEFTSGNISPEHLPGTISPAVVSRSPVVPGPSLASGLPGGPTGAGHAPGEAGSGAPGSGIGHKSSWDAAMGGTGQSRAGLGFAEGEWQREGLGKGLEQRLEDLVQNGRT